MNTHTEEQTIQDIIDALKTRKVQRLFDPYSRTYIGEGWILASVSTGSGDHETKLIMEIKKQCPGVKIALLVLDPFPQRTDLLFSEADIVLVNPIFPSVVRLLYQYEDIIDKDIIAQIYPQSRRLSVQGVKDRIFPRQQMSSSSLDRKFLDFSRNYHRLIYHVDVLMGWNLQYQLDIVFRGHSFSVNETQKKTFETQFKTFMRNPSDNLEKLEKLENVVYSRYLFLYYQTLLLKSKRSVPCFFFIQTGFSPQYQELFSRGVAYHDDDDHPHLQPCLTLSQFVHFLSKGGDKSNKSNKTNKSSQKRSRDDQRESSKLSKRIKK